MQARVWTIAGAAALMLAAGAAVTVPSLAASKAERAQAIFAQLDADGDGAIEHGELTQARAAMFDRLDLDGDGSVVQAEAEEARARAQETATANGFGQGRGGAHAGPMFGRLDSDGDGRVARAEFMARPYRLLERADADGDGRVTQAELAAVRGKGFGSN